MSLWVIIIISIITIIFEIFVSIFINKRPDIMVIGYRNKCIIF